MSEPKWEGCSIVGASCIISSVFIFFLAGCWGFVVVTVGFVCDGVRFLCIGRFISWCLIGLVGGIRHPYPSQLLPSPTLPPCSSILSLLLHLSLFIRCIEWFFIVASDFMWLVLSSFYSSCLWFTDILFRLMIIFIVAKWFGYVIVYSHLVSWQVVCSLFGCVCQYTSDCSLQGVGRVFVGVGFFLLEETQGLAM